MNPQNNSELPPVHFEAQDTLPPAEQQLPLPEQVTEQQHAQAIEQGVSTTQPVSPPLPIPQPVASLPQAVPVTPVPQIADDLDLIEKEWVEKAKAIVEQTKHDPRVQSREINRFKADYLSRRFNKELKLEEE